MANLFKNDYHVYLYKYDYNKLQKKVESLFRENNAYKFLFESFVTDLYSLGIPSDEVFSGSENKPTYKGYVDEYYELLKKTPEQTKKQNNTESGINYTYVESTDLKTVDSLNSKRSTRSPQDNILQQALAQNYALHMLQRDYEDAQMTSNARTHWLNTIEKKEKYNNYIKTALQKSKTLLDKIFSYVIDDLVAVQDGKSTSEYVRCIELTSLTKSDMCDLPETSRTKNTFDNFLNSKLSNKILPDDVKTNALVSIGAIQTDLENPSNLTSFTLRQDILLKYNIILEPNDIIEITATNYTKSISTTDYKEININPLNRNTQFIGFITKLALSSKYGQVSDINVTCEGISKMLSLNPSISSNAINPQFSNIINFITGKNKTDTASEVNVYETFFSGKTVYDIFTLIMESVLGARPLRADEKNYTLRYVSSPDALRNMPYQYCKSLLVLYHMAVSLSTIRECGLDTKIIIAQLDCNLKQSHLEAYLTQLRGQFNLFWSTYIMPLQVLQSIVSAAFLEIYEDRCGILIMRTPRYNVWVGKDIIYLNEMIEWSQSIDDINLKSRADYQWAIDFIGTQASLPGGSYQNIPALLKYGFRAESPQTSPNAQSEELCAVFSALSVTKANSKTRQLTVTVPMIKDYKLGKLYYIPVQDVNDGNIESVGCVGYLSHITSNTIPEQVDHHILTFTYVRNAELLSENNSQTGNENYNKVLNFTHLPDIELFMNKFVEDNVSQEQSTAVTHAKGLVGYVNRYWAEYDKEDKDLFDSYVDGSIQLKNIKDSNYTRFDRTTAPTVLSKSSFRKYKNVDNTSYIPSQQLINDIWYLDMKTRAGEPFCEDLKHLDATQLKQPIAYTKVLRSKAYERRLKYLINRDATIGGNVYFPAEIKNDLRTYYAHINNYIVRSSLIPAFCHGVNNSKLTELDEFMQLYATALNFLKKYQDSDIKIKTYLETYYKNTDNSKYLSTFTTIIKMLDDVLKAYQTFTNDTNSFYNFYSQMLEVEKTKHLYNMLYEYNLHKIDTDALSVTYKTLLKKSIGGTLSNWIAKWFSYDFGKKDLFSEVFKDVLSSVTEKMLPAVIINKDVTDTKYPPIIEYTEGTGAYLAGVCPIDYSAYFKKKIRPGILNLISDNKLRIGDMTLKNVNGTAIAEIKKLKVDASKSSDQYIVCYPVVEPYIQNLKSVYNIEQLNAYAINDADIDAYLKGESKKLPAAVIIIGPTEIPTTKIPTIQQMALQDGLYAADILDTEGEPRDIAIFDPSVLYNWTLDELHQTYTATIYNNIGSNNSAPTMTDISNNLKALKCVYTTTVDLYNLDFVTTDDTIKDNICNWYTLDNKNKYLTITPIENSSMFKLEDRHILNSDEAYSIVAMLENVDSLVNYSAFNTDTYAVQTKIEQHKLTSVDQTDATISNEFFTYVSNREAVMDSVCTESNYIKYSKAKLYPSSCYRSFNLIKEKV